MKQNKTNSKLQPDFSSLTIFFQDKVSKQGYVVRLKDNQAQAILNFIEDIQDGSVGVSRVTNLERMSIKEVEND